MSTKTAKEFDYQAYFKDHAPENVERGQAALRRRMEATTHDKATIRIDKTLLEQFQQLAPDKKDWEALIQTALREWLARQEQKKTVREEARDLLQEALSSAQMQIVIKLPERVGELVAAH